MVKGLDRPMFSGQQPTGLGAFQGRALHQRGMPMSGIMKFANGGDVEDPEAIGGGTTVSENYRKLSPYDVMGAAEGRPEMIKEGSFLDYILKGGSGGLRGDVSEGLAAIISTPEGATRAATELLGLEYDSQTPYSKYLAMTDPLLGIEGRLPSETMFSEDVTFRDEEGNVVPNTQVEEINRQLLGQTEEAITDPQAQQAADAVATDADVKLAKAEANEDIYGGMLSMVPDAQVSDDPEENRKEVMRRLQQQAATMGMELTDEEADPQLNPHIGTALILAGGAMMQQTGNVGQAIGKGLETGASFLANKAEKEAERAADIQEARIRAEYGGTDASVIQEAREAKRVYGAAFPNATDADFFNFAVRSTQADPALVEQTLVQNLMDAGETSATVAGNYAKMFVNSQTAMGLGEDNPKVAIGPNGDTLTMREVEDFAKNYMNNAATKKQAKDAGATTVAKALSVLGYRPIPLDQISKFSNPPATEKE